MVGLPQQATLGAVGLVYWSREMVLALNDCLLLARYQAGRKTSCVIKVVSNPIGFCLQLLRFL